MAIDSHLTYLQKNAFCPPAVEDQPEQGLGLVVTLPCHNEPDLRSSLQAIWDCQQPECPVEVIVAINAGSRHSEAVHQQNQKSLAEAQAFFEQNNRPGRKGYVLYHPDLPPKHAGVGLARKIAMDEAVSRFEKAGAPGIIACFDADASCDPNYLQALYEHFLHHPKSPGCSIYYEHPLEGPESELVYQGIIRYELYLRYYVLALRWTGHPHAFHTIGSSMAVRSEYYEQQGGMNRRKAGEDFYFLHKLIPLGHFSELMDTRIIPSPRVSDRVPFGTGKAISDWLEDPQMSYPVYHPEAFSQLRSVLAQVDTWFDKSIEQIATNMQDWPESLRAYFQKLNFRDELAKIKANTTQIETFRSRFFRWFNGLRTLQYFHFVRDGYLPNLPVREATLTLLQDLAPSEISLDWNEKDLLLFCRKFEREG